MNAVLLGGTFLVLALLGTPIVFALASASIFYVLFVAHAPLIVVAQKMAASMRHFPLIAVPMYVLMARLMNEAGVSDNIFRFARNLVGHVTGSLGHVNVLASMIFSGISGSALADVAGLGRIEIQAMTRERYPLELSAAVTAASAIIGPIIPPSILMIVYGSLAETSIIRLFMGGIVPGTMMGLSMMILIYFIARRGGFAKHPRAPFREIYRSFFAALPALLTPLIILAGLVGGVFTPTEAAIVAAFYALVLGGISQRSLSLGTLTRSLIQSAVDSAVILYIIAAAALFSWGIARENVPELIQQSILGFTDQRWVFLLIVNVIFLIVGCFLEPLPVMILFVPIFLPLLRHYGVDPVHFGVFFTVNVMIGMLTPPVGTALFVVADITGLRMDQVVRAVIPFYLPLAITLLLITYFDQFVLFLPNLIMGPPG